MTNKNKNEKEKTEKALIDNSTLYERAKKKRENQSSD